MTKRRQSHFSNDFKLKVLSEYYSSGKSKKFIGRRWGIDTANIRNWQKIWPIDSKELSLPEEIISTYRMGGKDRGKPVVDAISNSANTSNSVY